MSRPRKQGNKALPNNLHRKLDKRTGKTYYTYRHPVTGKDHGLGIDHDSAVNDAIAMNSAIYTSIRSAQLVSIASPKQPSVTVSKVIERHLELVGKRNLAQNTQKHKAGHINMWMKLLGKDTLFESITVRDIVEKLNRYEDRPGQLLVMRSEATDIWKDALQEGWADDNIPLKTRNPSIKVMRSRLTLEDYQKIHKVAITLPNKWLAMAMELALVTAQRREDVAIMEFRQRKESTAWVDVDALFVIQQKTKNKIRIPLNIGINGLTIGLTVKSCRDNILTNWMIHHSKHKGTVNPGDPVQLDNISKSFAKARKLAGVIGEAGKTPPTFHEIRSLSIRLYAEQYGQDFSQAIAGHKDAATSALYQDVRGSEWVSTARDRDGKSRVFGQKS